jgi:hypothetical protein
LKDKEEAMTLKQKALAHYDRMIEWADKQPKRGLVSELYIEDAIGEDWSADHCPYCLSRKSMCFGCNLNPIQVAIITDVTPSAYLCCSGLWYRMLESSTWGTWVKRARAVREYIEKHG